MGKGGSQTIGYKYSMSLLMGLCRGSISELVEIKVGGKTAWRGPACREDSIIDIDAKDLFGGDEKEGGIYGPCRIQWGDPAQIIPNGAVSAATGLLPDLRSSVGGDTPELVPDLRGVTTLWYDGEICSLNPYPKEWKVRMRRTIHGWYGENTWYPKRATIYMTGPEIVSQKRAVQLGDVILAVFNEKGGSLKANVSLNIPGNIKAMNGAHIIYECVTNPEWGRGITADLIDENSFIYAANKLCAEEFGLCFFWSRQEDVDVFIQTVIDHIGGVLYTDRSTGLLTLRLIRDDYDVDDIPTFTPGDGLLDILVDDSGSQDIAYNEVVVKYHDPIRNVDGEARARNPGARLAQGSTNSLSKEYPGLPTQELAARIATRELIVQSSGLKKFKVRLDRSGWRVAPGMPFRVVCPARGIASIVLRAGEIVDSSAQSGGDIQISAIEDVFSMPATGMVTPENPTWTRPVTDPIPPDDSIMFELSYYDMTKNLNQFEVQSVDDEDAYFGVLASQPLPTQLQYDLMYKDAAHLAWTQTGTFSFTGNAVLASNVDYLTTTIYLDQIEHFPADIIGDSLMVGDERMRIDTWDADSKILTVARGVADTLPRRHLEGARVWLPDDDLSSNRTIYAPGEIIHGAAATRTNSAVLAETDYVDLSLTIMGRVGRPYPVADLRVGGESIFDTTMASPEPVLTWVPRNRLLQADHLVGQTEPGVVAEAGTTYEVVVSDADGVWLSSHPVGEGVLTFTYDADMWTADGEPNIAYFDVATIRGDQRSLYRYDMPVTIMGGWNFTWGFGWGS